MLGAANDRSEPNLTMTQSPEFASAAKHVTAILALNGAPNGPQRMTAKARWLPSAIWYRRY